MSYCDPINNTMGSTSLLHSPVPRSLISRSTKLSSSQLSSSPNSPPLLNSSDQLPDLRHSSQMSRTPVSFDPPEALRSIYDDNAANSPLLRLPLELRLCIYRHCIRGYWIEVQGNRSYTRPGFPFDSKPGIVYSNKNGRVPADKHPKLFALAQTCRQMLEETWILPYQLSVFTVNKRTDFDEFIASIVIMKGPVQAFRPRFQMRRNAMNALSLGGPLAQALCVTLNGLPMLARLLPRLEKVYVKSWKHGDLPMERFVYLVRVFWGEETDKPKVFALTQPEESDQEGS
ncbi:hypothetical protein IQ07DRAFT_650579 [Pyrenochaeta sp. DS3sAY3a]|nr:hypothetical protein IQ07DRAFT_650579 [Pyrenochaeta sp. DS3sAY3a]